MMDPAEFRVEPLDHRRISLTTVGVDRITVAAADCRPLSLIRKRLRRFDGTYPAVPDLPHLYTGAERPDHWAFWRREADAYASGWLQTLAPGLRAPTCYAVETGDDEATLWLQDVRGTPAHAWSAGRFALAMQHLGRFQGRFVSGEVLPELPFLTRGYLAVATPQPPVDGADAGVRELVRRRAELVARIDATPRTICHLDLWTANMFADDMTTVVIDWSAMGTGALGEDVANAVYDSVWMCQLESALLNDLSRDGIAAYVAGLRESGWAGDEREVRSNYLAVAALRFGPMLGRVERWRADPSLHADLERRYALPAAEVIARRTAVCRHALQGFAACAALRSDS